MNHPCNNGCRYACDMGMPEHSCSGHFCDHYQEIDRMCAEADLTPEAQVFATLLHVGRRMTRNEVSKRVIESTPGSPEDSPIRREFEKQVRFVTNYGTQAAVADALLQLSRNMCCEKALNTGKAVCDDCAADQPLY